MSISGYGLQWRLATGGFTLIELLVVIVMIGTLIGLLLPAIQAARETARRAQCANNLCQVGVAMANYEAAHEMLPPGVVDAQGPIANVPTGYHISWIAQILPFIEQDVLFQHLEFSVGAYDPANAAARASRISILGCPSDVATFGRGMHSGYEISSFAACHHDVEAPIDRDNHGMFYLNSRVRSAEVPDGASQTIYAGEKKVEQWDFGWLSGTRSTLRNTGTPINGDPGWLLVLGPWKSGMGTAKEVESEEQAEEPPETMPAMPGMPGGYPGSWMAGPHGGPPQPGWWAAPTQPIEHMAPVTKADQLKVGGFSSHHPGGANFVFGDGSVRLLHEGIDMQVYQQLGHRDDGKLLTLPP